MKNNSIGRGVGIKVHRGSVTESLFFKVDGGSLKEN